jgi:putative nucleotidyltransferase with HDIG domain
MDMIEIKSYDNYTYSHSLNVGILSAMLAGEIGISRNRLEDLALCALMHDIGKIGIPDEIINKEGILSNEEYEVIKRHPKLGYDLLKDMTFLDSSSKILLQHHERIDGKGYPYGLEAHEIDKLAKILAVADAYDAMTTIRPYRVDKLTDEQAIVEFASHKNTQFDEVVVDVFIDILLSGDMVS